MIETISTPGATSITTSVLTTPSLMLFTMPLIWLRALSFMGAPFVNLVEEDLNYLKVRIYVKDNNK